VAADLDRPVAVVGHQHGLEHAPGVQLDLALRARHRAGRQVGLGAGRRGGARRGRERRPDHRGLEVALLRGDGVVNRHQLRAVRERRLDLHLGDHLGHARHDVGDAQQLAAGHHHVGHGAPVADPLHHLRRDQRRRLRRVQFHPARQPLLRQPAALVQLQVVDLARRELHAARGARREQATDRAGAYAGAKHPEKGLYIATAAARRQSQRTVFDFGLSRRDPF